MTNEELVRLIARCWVDAERLKLDLAACGDTATDCLEQLGMRGYPNPVGAVFAEVFGLWMGDPQAQEWHQADLDLRRKAERLLRDWKDGNL